MSVYRRHKKTNYTCIDNHVFKDHSLSMKAKGLLTQIYSLPDDWEYSVKGLSTLFSDGRDAVNNALQELIDHGYIVRTQKQNQAGKFDGYEYDIYEQPQTENADKPFTENPLTDNPLSDNPNQLNTNILNNKEVNTKEIKNIYGGDFFESLPDEPSEKVLDEKEKALAVSGAAGCAQSHHPLNAGGVHANIVAAMGNKVSGSGKAAAHLSSSEASTSAMRPSARASEIYTFPHLGQTGTP